MSWTGKILRVNLTEGKAKAEDWDTTLTAKFIGGRGMATKFLYDEIDPKVDPLSPGNKLIFATGPLTGTGAPSSGRYMVVTKSPLTGTIACSNSGGYFPAEMKFAGYDFIIFEGKASKPVYLWIHNGEAEIRDASDLWGKGAVETDDILRQRTDPDARMSCVGQAGEKLVKIACVMNDKYRAAGRTGVGAVMGSKNLKAVAVRGTKGIKVADKEAFRQACLEVMKRINESPFLAGGMRNLGTPGILNVINESGVFPARNSQIIGFPGGHKISGEALAETYLIKNRACFGCAISCGRMSGGLKDPKYPAIMEGPEYETMWSYGAQCDVDDIAAIIKANYLCNDLGMDTISAGVTVACAMELFEKGIISEKEVGRRIPFGDAEAIVELTEKMGLREGFGDVLAEGAYRMAERYGHPELAMTVKKQEVAAYEPRGAQGMGLGYATSNRGGCHCRGYTIGAEVFGMPMPMDRTSTEGKAFLAKMVQDLTAAMDSAGLCLFVIFGGYEPKDAVTFIKSAVGIPDFHEGMLMMAGERIWNQERLFNLKAGFTSADDTLPPRHLKEAVNEGPSKGLVNQLDKMLPEYYGVRGWDREGRPTEDKVRELGL